LVGGIDANQSKAWIFEVDNHQEPFRNCAFLSKSVLKPREAMMDLVFMSENRQCARRMRLMLTA
jgi:hypothetical protein